MAATHRYLQEESKIPLLLAANLESGGTGIAGDGTDYGCQMLVAATEQPERAYELGTVCAKEGTACGCNWAFAPVADIDFIFVIRSLISEPMVLTQNVSERWL